MAPLDPKETEGKVRGEAGRGYQGEAIVFVEGVHHGLNCVLRNIHERKSGGLGVVLESENGGGE